MVHAALSKVGPMLGGPDEVISALRASVGATGTVLAYADWDARYECLFDGERRIAEEWRAHIPPFDPQTSRAVRDHGFFPEFLRTTSGARRSARPGPSVVALGAQAEWLIADHAIDYGYSHQSPFAKLVAASGKVLMLGAPLDTLTLLHHAEHLAQVTGNPIKRYAVPFARVDGTVWRRVEEFDTSAPIGGLPDNVFGAIVRDYLATGAGTEGMIGDAPSVLLDAPGIVGFGVSWLEARLG